MSNLSGQGMTTASFKSHNMEVVKYTFISLNNVIKYNLDFFKIVELRQTDYKNKGSMTKIKAFKVFLDKIKVLKVPINTKKQI